MHTQNERKETRESREKKEMKNNNITIKRRATRTFACEQVTADLFSTFYHNSWVKLQSKQQQKVNRIQISKAQMTSVNTTESKCRQEQSLLTIKHLVFALFVGFLLRSSEKPEQVWTKKNQQHREIFLFVFQFRIAFDVVSVEFCPNVPTSRRPYALFIMFLCLWSISTLKHRFAHLVIFGNFNVLLVAGIPAGMRRNVAQALNETLFKSMISLFQPANVIQHRWTIFEDPTTKKEQERRTGHVWCYKIENVSRTLAPFIR